MSRKLEYKDWLSTIEDLRKGRQSWDSSVLRQFNMYRGKQWSGEYAQGDEITVNLTYANTQIQRAMLYYQDPYFKVRPMEPQDAPMAVLAEQVLNYKWYQLAGRKIIKKNIVDTTLAGLAWACAIHTQYHIEGALGGALNKPDGPAIIYSSPLDIFTELDLANPGEATFFIRRVFPSVRILKKAFSRYEWQADAEGELIKDRRRTTRMSFTPTRAVLYEITDLVEREIICLAPQLNKILFRVPYPYSYLSNSNFEWLAFDEDPDGLFPLSESEIVEVQQLELNKIRTQQMKHRKRFNRRYIQSHGAFDEEELTKIEQGEDGTIAEASDNVTNLQNCLVPVPDAQISPDVQIYQNDIKTDIREIQGLNEYARSGMVPKTKSASEASMINQGSQIRTRDKSLFLEDHTKGLASKLLKIIQHEFEEVDYLPIVGQEGVEQYRAWSREDIQGDFEVEVGIGSMLPPQPVPFEVGGQMAGPEAMVKQGGGSQ